MREKLANPALAICLLLLAGCTSMTATGPTPAPGTTAATGIIGTTPATLALIDVPEPAKLSVVLIGHRDSTGSVERQMFYIAWLEYDEKILKDALKPQSFLPGAALTEALAAALPQTDRSVVRVANPRSERYEFLDSYASLGSKAGTYLDVVPLVVGYWNESPTGPFRPWLVLNWRVYSNLDNKVVASGVIGTGPARGDEPMFAIPPDKEFAFPSLEAVSADPARAVAGLRAAMRQVARALAQKL